MRFRSLLGLFRNRRSIEVEDISQQKRVEEAPRESEERSRSIIAPAVDAIIVINEAGEIQSINPAGERMLGYASSELTGRDVSLQATPDDFIERFGERIQCLAASQDVLVKNKWKGASSHDSHRSSLISAILLAGGSNCGASSRYSDARGPTHHSVA
jgi:PAS domain S-box-containing protein